MSARPPSWSPTNGSPPGDVVDEVGLVLGHRVGERRPERVEVLVVAAVVGKADVHRGGLLDRIVVGLVDVERVDPRVVPEDVARSVALVDVGVDDDRPRDALLVERVDERERDVVEEAEPLARVRRTRGGIRRPG